MLEDWPKFTNDTYVVRLPRKGGRLVLVTLVNLVLIGVASTLITGGIKGWNINPMVLYGITSMIVALELMALFFFIKTLQDYLIPHTMICAAKEALFLGIDGSKAYRISYDTIGGVGAETKNLTQKKGTVEEQAVVIRFQTEDMPAIVRNAYSDTEGEIYFFQHMLDRPVDEVANKLTSKISSYSF
ncbi:hypothetical protein H6504_05145 [Candidatus Woesearchaeota archaeon]|nr:hypothetical protein [Candidatus Woesearchaeota archaeon]